MGAIVRRISYTPFNVCRTPDSATLDAITSHGSLERLERHPWSTRLVPQTVRAWAGVGTVVALDVTGIGLVVRSEETLLADFGPESAAQLIVDRRNAHRAASSGNEPSAALCADLQQCVRTVRAQRKERQRLRPQLWGSPPYVLSTYFVVPSCRLGALENDQRKAVAGLLEPTRFEEAGAGELAHGVDLKSAIAARLRETECEHVAIGNSIDHSVDTLALASWAGLVVVCEQDLLHRQRQYEALEVRAQLAWATAHYLREWAELSTREDAHQIVRLSEFETATVPRLRNLAHLSTGSTRQSGIFDAIVKTSGLNAEIEIASATLELAHRLHDYRSNERRRRLNHSIELLLGVVAIGQIIPLFVETPVWRAPGWLILSLLALAALLLASGARR